MSKCIAVVVKGVEVAYFPYHDNESADRADELADRFMADLPEGHGGHHAWKRIVLPLIRVTTASGMVYESAVCEVETYEHPGETRLFSCWYMPALDRCKYVAIIPETVEYIS